MRLGIHLGVWAAALLLSLPAAHGALKHAHSGCYPAATCALDAADAQVGSAPAGLCPLCLASSQGRNLASPAAATALLSGPAPADAWLPAAPALPAPLSRGAAAPRAPPA